MQRPSINPYQTSILLRSRMWVNFCVDSIGNQIWFHFRHDLFQMGYMFQGATAFNQNLCNFNSNWPYTNVTVMFDDSGCSDTNIPANGTGPWCAASYCHPFTTNSELSTAIKQYLSQGCSSDLNCQARSDYGGAVSSSLCCCPLAYHICVSHNPFWYSDWGLGRV